MPTFTTNYNLAKPLVNDPTDQDLWGGYLNGDMDTIDTQMFANAQAIAALVTVPTGSVLPFAGASPPASYLMCSGQAVSRTTYSVLFATIGSTYGPGDGSTTFNVPDLRGRVAAGVDNMGGTPANRITSGGSGIGGTTLGAAGGAETHTLTATEVPSHTHQIGFAQVGNFGGSVQGVQNYPGSAGNATSSSAGSDGAHQNTQPTIMLNYIIRT